jgi:peptidyl-prolyl cis-trans isomerase A (cyclophilin A)
MAVSRVSRLVCLIAVVCVAIGCDEGGPATDPAIPKVDTANGPLPEKGPDEYWVKLETTKGDVYVEVHRAWSPYGADRFYELVKSGFYDQCKFFRVAGFVVQFGISGDPHISAKWRDANIPDDKYKRRDPDRHSNSRGYLTFAKSQAPDSRTTQIFINCVDNAQLDRMGFTPLGIVLSGMGAIDSLYSGYGEEPTASQDRMQAEGDAYFNQAFPKLDSIKKATVLPGKPDVSKLGDGDKKAREPKASATPPAPAKKPAE